MTNHSGIGSGARLALGAVTTVGVLGGGVYLAATGSLGPSAQSGVRMVYEAFGGGDDTFVISAPLNIGGVSENRPSVAATSLVSDTTVTAPTQNQAAEPIDLALPAPVLDLVRIDPDGSGLVAGSGKPGATVAVLLDGTEIETLVVPPEGDFAAFVTIVPSTAPRVLSLMAHYGAEEVPSDARFILAPIAAQTAEPEAIAGTSATETAPKPPSAALSQKTALPLQQSSDSAENTALGGAAPSVSSEVADTAMPPVSSGPTVQDTLAGAANTSGAIETPTGASPDGTAADVVARIDTQTASQPAVASDAAAALSTPDQAIQTPQTQQSAEAGAGSDVSVASVALQEQPQPNPAALDVASAAPAAPSAPAATAAVTGGATAADRDDTAANTIAVTSQTQADTADGAAQADGHSAPQPSSAIAVLRADKDGVSLIQSGTLVAPELLNKIALDTISYSESGEVQLAGRARPEALVRVYLDNSPVIDLPTQEDGRWSGSLTSVAPGIYTLRLDEIDPIAGKVLSRLETPFKRETPEALQPAAQDSTPGQPAVPAVRAVTVQTGDTLWAISQDRYGTGFLYVRVFEANKTAIRDPDLIYPGQIFTLPE